MSTADTWLGFDGVRPVFNASAHYAAPITANSKLLSTTSSGRHRGIDFGTWRNSKSTIDDINITSKMCQSVTPLFFFQEAIAQLALKNELIIDRLANLDVRAGYDTIRAELMDLESQMKQIQDSVETFKRLQQRFI